MVTLPGLDSPTISEFIAHPDYQQISAFFLGAVFITSLQYSSTWFRGFLQRMGTWVSRSRSKAIDIEDSCSEKISIAQSSKPARAGKHQSLVFTLSICFAFASIAYFGSLLSFSTNDGGALCAFVVAWGGMAAQTARIVGLAILFLELRDLGIPRVEFYAIMGWLCLGMVLVFINNAIGTGITRAFEPLGMAICYRKHFLPTALVSSLLYIFLEIYSLLRLASLIKPGPDRQSHRLSRMKDFRIGRAISLLLLELLTIVPSVKHFTILADFIPLSIGALIVLAAFNLERDAHDDSRSRSDSSASQWSVAPRVGPARLSYISSQRGIPAQLSSSALRSVIPHPFSAQSLNDTTSQEYAWVRQNQHHMRANGSDIVIRTEEGIIQVVEHGKAPTLPGAVVLSHTSVHGSSSNTPQSIPSMRHDQPMSTIVSPIELPDPPAPSPASPPSSILLHPWHRSKRPDSMPVSPRRFSAAESEKSPTSANMGSETASYLIEGYTFPLPPISTPLGRLRRYTTYTLTSPMMSQEGGESQTPVRLLTFESNFRAKDGRPRSALPSPADPILPH
ncbi:hypothetical protein Hypma_010137 [Hypsizygus marmoreus]|uniref:Uncharacterized protein n=1 Tax=Hypsizygus marmoreus TaxID=39966 RepID=A0A369JT03_HYPMA|nr:hypothetical protein Hypma_010137 [Hypsizygus marmoreus]